MNRSDLKIQQDLIGYVLETLEDDERLVFEARLLREPELASEVEAMRRVVKPLDAWQAEEPPAGSVDAIMARVKSTSPLEYVASSTSITPEYGAAPSGRSRISLREVVALAACIALIVGVFVPGMNRMRSQQLRMACGDNLARVFGGATQYMHANNGQLPRTTVSGQWPAMPNRVHFAPAIRLKFVAPNTLICPTSPETVSDATTVYENPQQFLKNVRVRFYSIQNLSGLQVPADARGEMPLMSDPNPRFDGDPSRGRMSQPVMNSRAHNGQGQNTLFLDGSVRFLPKPFIREETDNIWQAETESPDATTPQSATDAFLIP